VAAAFSFAPSGPATVCCALAVLALATTLNLTGTKMPTYFAIFGFAAELIGALVVGVWLLLAQRHHVLAYGSTASRTRRPQLPLRLSGRQPDRPLPILRVRGVWRRCRGGPQPRFADPEVDAPHHLHRGCRIDIRLAELDPVGHRLRGG
jgi:hypothetical protein